MINHKEKNEKLREFQRILKTNPKDFQSQLNCAIILLTKSIDNGNVRDAEKAICHFNKAIDLLTPNDIKYESVVKLRKILCDYWIKLYGFKNKMYLSLIKSPKIDNNTNIDIKDAKNKINEIDSKIKFFKHVLKQ